MLTCRVTGVVVLGGLYVAIKHGVDVSTILHKYDLDEAGACTAAAAAALVACTIACERCAVAVSAAPRTTCMHDNTATLCHVPTNAPWRWACPRTCSATIPGHTVGMFAGAVFGGSALWPASMALSPYVIPAIARLTGSTPQ